MPFGSGTKTGAAATGADGDAWNLITAPTTVASHYNSAPIVTWGAFTNLVWSSGDASPVEIVVTNLTSAQTMGQSDEMLSSWLQSDQILVWDYDEETFEEIVVYANPEIEVRNLAAGSHELYLYAFGSNENDCEGFRVKVGAGSWSSWKFTEYPLLEDPCFPPPSLWTEGVHYVMFSGLSVSTGDSIWIQLAGNDGGTHILNGIQIDGPGALTPLPEVAFSPADGTSVPVSVTLSVSGYAGATIYYTTDGSTPTTSSSVYSSAIVLDAATTVKAFAIESAHANSAISQATYPLPDLPYVSFSPSSGASLPVTVTMSVLGHDDASIYYTTDGTTPTASSFQYSSAISLATASWTWSVDRVPTMTSWDAPSGNLAANSSVEASSSNEGWKAMDANPDTYWRANSAANEWVSLAFPSDRVIAAYALSSLDTDGPKDWTFEGWDGGQWDVLDARSGETGWFAGEVREYVCASSAAHLKYRLNISSGNASAANAAGLVTLAEIEMFEATTQLKAFAAKSSYNNSGVAFADYHVDAADIPQIAPRPTITPASGDYANDVQIVIASSLVGAAYQWSTNGTDWNAYAAPIDDSVHGTIQAFTTKAGYIQSPTTIETYTFTCALTEFSPAPGLFADSVTVTLANDTEGAELFYSLNNGPLVAYVGPVDLEVTTVFSAVATNPNFISSTNTVTFTREGVNAPPLITLPSAQSVDEDILLAITGLSVSDSDAGAGLLELTLHAPNGMLTVGEPAGLSVLAGVNGVTTNLLLKGTLATLNSALAGLSYQSQPDFNGADSLHVAINDMGYSGNTIESATDSLSITVAAVNDAPSFVVTGATTFPEDYFSPQVISFTLNPPPADEAGETITWNVSPSSLSFAEMSFDSNAGTITLIAIADGNGSAPITVTADDAGLENSSFTKVFTLSVNAVNDPKPFNLSGDVTVTEDFATPQTVTVTPLLGPADEMGETITYSLSPSVVSFAGVSIDQATGAVTIQSVADGAGTQVFSVLSYDGGFPNGLFQKSFVLTVNGVNDAPSLSLPAALTAQQDTALAIVGLSVSDVDVASADLELQLSATHGDLTLSPTAGLTFIAGANGSGVLTAQGSLTDLNAALAGLSYTPDTAYIGDDTIVIDIDDLGATGTGGALSDSANLAVLVMATSPAPDPGVTPAGGAFNAAVSVALSSTLAGSEILYSTDDGQSWSSYSDALTLEGDVTLLTKNTKYAYADSGTLTNVYIFSAPASSVSPDGGLFTASTQITLSNALTGAALEYSFDRGENWNAYSGDFALDGIGEGTGAIHVRATKTGYADAITQSSIFTFASDPPAYSQSGGSHTNAVSLALSTATTGASIEYSFDALTWKPYSAALNLRGDITVYSRTVKAGYLMAGHVSYDAAVGVSDMQGGNGWLFQAASTLQGAPDTELDVFDHELNSWSHNSEPLCQVAGAWQAPGANYDAVRSFLVPNAGPLQIIGHLTNDNPGAGTDGVRARVLTNAVALIDWTTVGNNSIGAAFDASVTLAAGDLIRFQLNQNANATNDRSLWSPRITYTHSQSYSFPDTDGDGLSDLQETVAGTNPGSSDTDGDGVDDYLEIIQGRDPLIAGAVPDTSNLIRLILYTPLENEL